MASETPTGLCLPFCQTWGPPTGVEAKWTEAGYLLGGNFGLLQMPRGQGGKAACPVTKHPQSHASPLLLRAAALKCLLQEHLTLLKISADSNRLSLKGIKMINTYHIINENFKKRPRMYFKIKIMNPLRIETVFLWGRLYVSTRLGYSMLFYSAAVIRTPNSWL